MDNVEVIESLKGLDLSAYPYDEVKELVGKFHPKFLRLTISAGQLINRIRPDIDVTERKDVSYRPDDQNKSPQRATLPGKTAFYGTLCHDEEPTINMRYIALLEASKLYRQGINATGKEQYTLSRWRTNSELRLVVFVHDTVFTDVHNNRILEMAKMEWEKGKTFIDGVFQFEEYGKYVTGEFAKPVSADYEYIISATIADKLLYATGVDGVMYPSVRAVGEYGMNVAMRPDVTDEKLILTDVREMEYAQEKGNGHLRFTKRGIPVEMDVHGWKRWRYNE